MTNAATDNPDLARLLLVGWRWFDDGLREGLRQAGFGEITTAQSMVFPFLDLDGTRPSDLAIRLGTTRQAAHQLITGLSAQGLVELLPDPTSKRSKLVRLTSRGQQSLTAAHACLRKLEQELAERIGAQQAGELRGLLLQAWPPEP